MINRKEAVKYEAKLLLSIAGTVMLGVIGIICSGLILGDIVYIGQVRTSSNILSLLPLNSPSGPHYRAGQAQRLHHDGSLPPTGRHGAALLPLLPQLLQAQVFRPPNRSQGQLGQHDHARNLGPCRTVASGPSEHSPPVDAVYVAHGSALSRMFVPISRFAFNRKAETPIPSLRQKSEQTSIIA